jgi:hypothetical protein
MIDELLREARPDVAPPDPVVVLRARRALLRTALVRRTRRRFATRIAIGTAAAAMIVAATVVAQTPNHGASAAAATILERSADAFDDAPVGGPGQYVYRKQIDLSWDYGPSPTDPAKEDTTPRTSPVVVETWVPTTSSKPLIQRTTDPAERVTWAVVSQTSNENYPIYRSQPQGPMMIRALRDLAIRVGTDTGTTDDTERIWRAAFWLLSDPQTPDQVRADVLRALTDVAGVEVVDRNVHVGDQVGVALGSGGTHAPDFVFDPATGAFLGMRGHPERGPDWVGPDEPTWTTQLESRIVDSAPRPPESAS